MAGKREHVIRQTRAAKLVAVRGDKHATQAGEEQYQLLFELNPCPMWICDEKTLKFLGVNEAALRLYGWRRQEFLQMTAKDIRPPEDVPNFLRVVRGQRKSRATCRRVASSQAGRYGV